MTLTELAGKVGSHVGNLSHIGADPGTVTTEQFRSLEMIPFDTTP